MFCIWVSSFGCLLYIVTIWILENLVMVQNVWYLNGLSHMTTIWILDTLSVRQISQVLVFRWLLYMKNPNWTGLLQPEYRPLLFGGIHKWRRANLITFCPPLPLCHTLRPYALLSHFALLPSVPLFAWRHLWMVPFQLTYCKDNGETFLTATQLYIFFFQHSSWAAHSPTKSWPSWTCGWTLASTPLEFTSCPRSLTRR